MNKNVRKLRSKNYKTVIEVLCPIRFYWDENGFDGIEIGKLKDVTEHEIKLIDMILDEMLKLNMKETESDCANCKRLTPIPNSVYKAFENE